MRDRGSRLQAMGDLAMKHYRAGRLENAASVYRKMLKLSPDNTGVLRALGLLLTRLRHHEEAGRCFRRALRLQPTNASFHYFLGISFDERGRHEEAASCYRRALVIDPRHLPARLNFGTTLSRLGKLEDAETNFRHALAIDPTSVPALTNLAHVLRLLHRPEHAAEMYRRAAAVKPNDAKIHVNLANTLVELDALQDAAATYRRALSLDPEDEATHVLLGNLMRRLHRPDLAVASYKHALARNPENAAALNNLGATWKDLGRYEHAIECYERSIAIQSDHAGAHFNLGLALRELGRNKEALAAFERGLELDPDNPTGRHYYAALTGKTTETAPIEYVRNLFDAYALKFDRHLTRQLGYDVPAALRRLLDSLRQEGERFSNALDIGCGTGLSGAAFRDVADRLVGVDLSPKMVEQARAKKVYDAIHLAEIIEFLQATQERYDLIVSTDVFIYVGGLERVFPAVRERMTEAATFLFSTERAEGDAYVLRESGRYAHAPRYIESLADAHGFDILARRTVNIRKERTSWIVGDLFALRCRNA